MLCLDMHTSQLLMLLLGSLLCDAFFGDPPGWPHPVRLLGQGFLLTERLAQKSFAGPRAGGTLVVLFLGAASFTLAALLGALPVVGFFLQIYLAWAGLALGCLVREIRAVGDSVRQNDLARARKQVAGLVSRDTAHMDRQEILRAAGESLAENFNDAFVAPFFWLCLGGPPLLWVYKTISTADSMWGYKTPRFVHIGWAGARLDDWAAWIPARISAGALVCAARLTGKKISWTRICREARSMESPNAGWPMSAAAHGVHVQMGGKTRYFGQETQKPLLGVPEAEWTLEKLQGLERLVLIAAALVAGSGVSLIVCFTA